MPNTYTLINKSVLGSATGTVTFSAIPSTFTDLVVLCSLRYDSAGTTNNGFAFFVRPNGLTTTSIYSTQYLQLTNGSVGSGQRSTANADSGSYTWNSVVSDAASANTFSNVEIYIPNYQSSNFKVITVTSAAENQATTTYGMGTTSNLIQTTAAITSLEFTYTYLATSNFVAGSAFYLYGIKNS